MDLEIAWIQKRIKKKLFKIVLEYLKIQNKENFYVFCRKQTFYVLVLK